MSIISNCEDRMPNTLQEMVCLRCFARWFTDLPEGVLLRRIVCANPICARVGWVIKTGQEINEEDLEQ